MSGHACPSDPRVSGRRLVTAVSLNSLAFCSQGVADVLSSSGHLHDDAAQGSFLHRDTTWPGIRDTSFFSRKTALACVPSPVDCQVTGDRSEVCVRACEHMYVCVFYFQAA